MESSTPTERIPLTAATRPGWQHQSGKIGIVVSVNQQAVGVVYDRVESSAPTQAYGIQWVTHSEFVGSHVPV